MLEDPFDPANQPGLGLDDTKGLALLIRARRALFERHPLLLRELFDPSHAHAHPPVDLTPKLNAEVDGQLVHPRGNVPPQCTVQRGMRSQLLIRGRSWDGLTD
jgi:hypothetical protein